MQRLCASVSTRLSRRKRWCCPLVVALIAVPLPAAQAGSPQEPSGSDSDDDLSAAWTQQSDLGEPTLRLYGFADFAYRRSLNARGSEWDTLGDRFDSFQVGNVNLYVYATPAEFFRSLAEIRFTYLSNGVPEPADGQFVRMTSDTPDYVGVQRTIRLGAIEMERVWLEYQPSESFTVRVGQWLTPVGVWNMDHGTPSIISSIPPYVIGIGLFPERQTGVQAYGWVNVDPFDLDVRYYLTLSNGRGPLDAYRDFDRNKAIGGRLELGFHWLGDLDLGVSFYRGRYSDKMEEPGLDPGTGEVGLRTTVREQFDELAVGADLRWDWQNLHVQAELMSNDRAYTNRGRPPMDYGLPGLRPDSRQWGAYGVVGYRTPFLETMPFVHLEHFDGDNYEFTAVAGGLNIRPVPSVVLKANITFAFFHGDLLWTGSPVEPIKLLDLQIAWAF